MESTDLEPTTNSESVTNPLLTLEDLRSEHEIWILNVPKHLCLDDLVNEKLSFEKSGGHFIEKKGRVYESKTHKKKSTIPVLIQKQNGNIKTASMSCRGTITISECVNLPECQDLQVPPAQPVQPAGKIKRRHPFYVGDLTEIFESKNCKAKKKKVTSENPEKKRSTKSKKKKSSKNDS